MSYVLRNFKDNQEPAINAENLNYMDQAIKQAFDARIVEHNLDVADPPNGYYVRWENGLQICFFRFTTPGHSITWTFPAAFVAVPIVQVSSRKSGNDTPIIMNFTDEPNTTSVTIQKWYWADDWLKAGAQYSHLLAIGRWK